jgi:hypothetical protein
MIGREKVSSASPEQAMNARPIRIAIQPEAAAPRGSRRPSAWPTRTAPAEATPRGTMKVRLDTLSVIWWAASSDGASRPASAVAVAKTPTSIVTWSAAGQPSISSRRIRAGSNRGRSRAKGIGSPRRYQRKAAISTRAR